MQFKRLERFVSRERFSLSNANRIERWTNKPDFVPKKSVEQKANEKVYLVMRIAGNFGAFPEANRVFRYFRLTRRLSAVLVKATPATEMLLAKAQQYLAWGTPDLKTVQDLLQKRGYACPNPETPSKVVALSDNKYIEQELGKYGIVCLEDIVHELMTLGPNFAVVAKWLAPFDLQLPKDGLKMSMGDHHRKKLTDEEKKMAAIEGRSTHSGYHKPAEIKDLVSRMI